MKGFTPLFFSLLMFHSASTLATDLSAKQLTRLDNDITIDRFNFETSSAGIVFKGAMARSVNEPVQDLIQFAEQNATQLGSTPGAKFKVIKTLRDQHDQLHVTLRETIHDLPIKLSEVKLHLNRDGALTRVNGSRAINTLVLNDFMRQWPDRDALNNSLKSSNEIVAASQLPMNTKSLTISTEFTYLSSIAPHVRRDITLTQQGATQPVRIIADALTGKVIKVHSAVKLNIDQLAQQR